MSKIGSRAIEGFQALSRDQRRLAVERERNAYLLRLQQTHQSKTYRQVKKNHRHTAPYIHLTYEERKALLNEVADCVADWGFARLFAECIDKLQFDPIKTTQSIDEQAFEQVVARFELPRATSRTLTQLKVNATTAYSSTTTTKPWLASTLD